MTNHNFFQNVIARATFAPEKMQKVDCFRSDQLLVGLNCLEPGQSQARHTHDRADKFYLVVSGRAMISVGQDTNEVGPGGIAWAPAGIPHGIERALDRTVVLIAMSPAPQAPAEIQSEQSPNG